MENCVVRQLKDVFNNDALRKPGEARIKMAKAGSFDISAVGDDSFKIKILTSGVTFTAPAAASGTTEQTVPATTNRSFTVSGPCEMAIYNKYAVQKLSNVYYAQVNIDEFTGTSAFTRIFFGAYQNLITGNLKSLIGDTNLTELDITSNQFKGELEDLMVSSTLYKLNLVYCDIGGDIANLSRLSHLVDFNLADKPRLYGNVSVFENISGIRDITFVGSLGVTGSISSFANHSNLRSPQLYGTSVTGTLGELLVGTPALKDAYLPVGVKWTDADAAIADERMQANGGSVSPSTGHYFGGGTHVDSY